MIKYTLPLAFALAIIASPGLAGTNQPEIRVATSDIDLSTDKGRSNLQARLRSAVKKACSSARTVGIRGQSRFRECVALKTDQANRDRNALVARVYGKETVASLR